MRKRYKKRKHYRMRLRYKTRLFYRHVSVTTCVIHRVSGLIFIFVTKCVIKCDSVINTLALFNARWF